MNPKIFFIPGYVGMRSMPLSMPMTRIISSPSRNVNLFSRIFSGVRSFNWGGLLNGANKTLNVVNQAIPLARQAAPMFNNMKSMLKIAKAFGSETTKNNKVNHFIRNNNNNNNNSDNSIFETEKFNGNIPNFFV